MKKKYSTLLNFALAGCLATTLVACGSDGDKSNLPKANSESNPKIDIGGVVVDTNGNPLADVNVSCQGKSGKTNAQGNWVIKKLTVTNVAGLLNDTNQEDIAVRCVIEAPAGYLGAIVSVRPEAQMDSLYSANAENDDETEYVPIVTFIDGMYAEAGTAWLPMLGSTVTGRLENCTTEASIAGATVKLDMQAVDNNNPETQAGSACSYGCSVDYSTAMYSAVTDANGNFSIANVPDDSILRLFVENYTDISMTGRYELWDSVGDEPDSTPSDEYLTTVDEGIVNMGDICAYKITAGDGARPCVVGVTDYVHALDFPQEIDQSIPDWNAPEWFEDTILWAVLPDDVDGTGAGIAVVFNEPMNPDAVDENSVVIWNEGPNQFDESDDDYVTDFTATIDPANPNILRIVTAEPLGDDDHLKIFMLLDDFQDESGNYLATDDMILSNDVCEGGLWVEDFVSNNGTIYAVVGVKIFSPDETDVDEVTNLVQNCTDYSAVVSGQTDLQEEYPTTFRSALSSTNFFWNLNADPDYEERLEALADVLECPEDITYNANIIPNHTAITFTAPTGGAWEVAGSCESNCYGAGDGLEHTAVVDASAGGTVCVDSLDDFDNVSAQACVTVNDCVAPTTVLNYAYNTCGHLGYDPDVNSTEWHGQNDGPGYDTDYAAHICVDFEAATLFEYGDGGENTGEGTPGVCGIPTLNITCRLLKDPADAQFGDVETPVSFFGLYTETRPTDIAGAFDLYDATEFAAWTPFSDTIGVAFSEDIAQTAGGSIGGTVTWEPGVITSWTVGNNIGTTDDGDAPDGGEGSTADLAQITVADVLGLANDYHSEVMDFSNAVEDTTGNPADNAQVVVNDLMPPFVEYAYWDGNLVIQFNEAVAPDTSAADTNCSAPSSTTDVVVLFQPNNLFAGPAHVGVHCATLSNNDTMLTIPAANLNQAGVSQGNYFPSSGTNAMVYDEPTVAAYVAQAPGPYNHGIMSVGDIPDAHGNTGYANAGGNQWSQWDNPHGANDFVDVIGGQLCEEPTFAVADVVGNFDITSQDLSLFEPGDPNCSVAATPVTHRITYTFSHPLDLDATFGNSGSNPGCSLTCDSDTTVSGECTVTEVNTTCLTGSWVDANVLVETASCNSGGAAIPMSTCGDFTGVNAEIAPDAMSMTIDFNNDCYDWQLGDVIDPDWIMYSAFGVGAGLNLNGQSSN